ncbi:hypothetical protein KA005_51135 [bacterium]|nr:hypothetical protein [bacterium]
MIEKILDIAFSGLFPFIGMMILLNIVVLYTLNTLYKSWRRFMRMLMVRKHGWPPEHLDADGDFTKKKPKKK